MLTICSMGRIQEGGDCHVDDGSQPDLLEHFCFDFGDSDRLKFKPTDHARA